jgi:hypothetical protein
VGPIFFLSIVAWVPAGPAQRASVTGGPWVLAQGATAFPTANPGTNLFQPYYQAHTDGSDTVIQGYFDYRPKDQAESIVAARSTDGGKSWTVQSEVLRYTPPAASPNDTGEGHPFVIALGGQTLLYTLDRSTGNVDSAGLFVRTVTPGASDPLAGAPATASPGDTSVQRTVGLTDPDGIIAVIPGTSNPLRVLYLSKDITPTPQVTSVHLADTTDGIHFTNDQVVSGLVTTARPFIGPRGTLVKYPDGHYGLFFSAGLPGEDSDAFHFIGYAESPDLMTWSVVNDVDNPLVSTDATKDPTGGQSWYAGRVYAPSVTFSADGCTGTMIFSGYKTIKPKDAIDDYRQVSTLTLGSCGATADLGTSASDMASGNAPDLSAGGNGGGNGGGGNSDGGSGGTGGGPGGGTMGPGSSNGGCSCDFGGAGAPGVSVLGVLLLLAFARRRHV